MDSSTGSSVLYHLPEFAQIHIHGVGDGIRASLPLLPPLPLLSIFLSIRVFSNESALCIRWPRCWSFSFSISPTNEYSGLISFGLVGSPCSPRDSQESFPTPQFKSINSLALGLFLLQICLPKIKSSTSLKYTYNNFLMNE